MNSFIKNGKKDVYRRQLERVIKSRKKTKRVKKGVLGVFRGIREVYPKRA